MFKDSQAIRGCCVYTRACVCLYVGLQVALTARDLGKKGAADHLASCQDPMKRKAHYLIPSAA